MDRLAPQEITNLLKAWGIGVDNADDEGRTALHGAAHKGRTDVIQLLVDRGANLEAHDKGSRDTFCGRDEGNDVDSPRLVARSGSGGECNRRRAPGSGEAADRAE